MSFIIRAARALPRPLIEALDQARKRSRILNAITQGFLRGGRDTVVTIPQGIASGLQFNTTGGVLRYGLGLAEEAVQEALAVHLKPGDVFYDVGANIGFLTLIGAKLVGATGRVVAFEPVPETVELLRQNAARNGFAHVDTVAAAAGATPGKARLILEHASQMAHLATVPGMAGGVSTAEIEVEVLTLDGYICEGGPAPDVVKIDVEGAEMDVLAGMSKTISERHPTIICEIHGTLEPVTEILTGHGYDVRRMSDEHGASLDHLVGTYLPSA